MPSPNSVESAITKLLDSAKTIPPETCHACGSQLEYYPCTFLFGGKSWNIPLPVCPICQPESKEPAA
jgi:hypothetical protein